MTALDLVAVAVAAVAAGLGALLVPWLVRSLPEPDAGEPVADVEAGTADRVPSGQVRSGQLPSGGAKALYVELGAARGLAAWSAGVAAVAGTAVGLGLGWAGALALWVPLVPVGVALGYVDWRTRLLPTRLVLPATGAAILVGAALALLDRDAGDLIRGLVALVATRSVFWLLWLVYPAGMGFGDVRLSALLGFALGYLGWAELVVGVYAAFVLFAVLAVVLLVTQRDRAVLKRAYPFGPFLLVGAVVGVVAGPGVAAYLG